MLSTILSCIVETTKNLEIVDVRLTINENIKHHSMLVELGWTTIY